MLPEPTARTDPSIEIVQAELLVRAVGTVVVQTPADEQNITAQRIDHLSDNGDRSTLANQDRLDSETFFDGSNGPLHELGIRIDHHSSATMQIDNLDPNSRRGMGCDELSELFANR